MYTKSTLDGSKNNAAPKGLTALLIGVIVCYQVINYVVLNHAFPEENGHDSDAACAANLGEGASSLCMEARLFKGWHEMPADSPDELEQLLAVSPRQTPEQQQPATTSMPQASPAATEAPRSMRGQGDASGDAVKGPQAPAENLLKAKPEALEGSLWDLAFKMGGGDMTHTPPEKNTAGHPAKKRMRGSAKAHKNQHKKPLTQDLTDLQQQLEAKMQAKARKHAEHRALRALTEAARETRQSSEVPAEGDGMTPWAHNLDDLTHELADHMEARRKARTEHDAAHAAKLAAARARVHEKNGSSPVSSSQGEDHSLLGDIKSLGAELCKDPSRHDLPVCAQFLKSKSSSPAGQTDTNAHHHHKDAHANAMAHIQLLEKHLEDLHKEREHDDELIKHESNAFMRELCSDPTRNSYPACAKLLAESSAPDATGQASLRASKAATEPSETTEAGAAGTKGLRGEAPRPDGLHWPAAKEWQALSKTPHGQALVDEIDTTPMLFFRQDLRGSHWSGKIPKVACVTVLPPHQTTETLMKYFMDNYKLQNYEGPNQLIIVYHNKDHEAARIARLYADGSSVVAAAARGDNAFPSPTSYRFGAWLAHDADVVARWDFEAWHHPNRLSMQVRSMVLSKRPASIVTRATFFDEAGGNTTRLGGIGDHGSMVGEATWMRKHWMPALEEENQVLLGVHARHVAQVEMAELLAYHDAPGSLE